jgi:hypothetical protein
MRRGAGFCRRRYPAVAEHARQRSGFRAMGSGFRAMGSGFRAMARARNQWVLSDLGAMLGRPNTFRRTCRSGRGTNQQALVLSSYHSLSPNAARVPIPDGVNWSLRPLHPAIGIEVPADRLEDPWCSWVTWRCGQGHRSSSYRYAPRRRTRLTQCSPSCDDSTPSPAVSSAATFSSASSSPIHGDQCGGNHPTGEPRNLAERTIWMPRRHSQAIDGRIVDCLIHQFLFRLRLCSPAQARIHRRRGNLHQNG